MTQAIAGVSPSELTETTIMTVWPTMASLPIGRALGAMFAGPGGTIFMFLTIPLTLPLYFFMFAPGICRRYRLTNRRVIVQRGLQPKDERWVNLDNFDSIEVALQPGEEWFRAGDLIFKKGAIETFRLVGVSRPQTFRHTCLKAQRAHVSVLKARNLAGAHA